MERHVIRRSGEMNRVIDSCKETHGLCTETITHCLTLGGPHADVNHIKLLRDCSDICEDVEEFMLRGSDFHKRICGVCAEICDRTEKDLNRFDDEAMKVCARSCRETGTLCREMAVFH
jgi:hypothetical protein